MTKKALRACERNRTDCADRYVYFISAPRSRLVKIGIAIRPVERLRNIQIGSPERLDLLFHFPGDAVIEHALHKAFGGLRQHGEWFIFAAPIRNFIKEIQRRPWLVSKLQEGDQ